jgi:electron transfer flavoprotein alpha subunit
MPNKILAILEQREGILKRSSFEVVQTAANLGSELKLEAEAVVVGASIENIDDIAKYGLNNVIHLKNAELKNYSSSAYTDLISDYAKSTDADYLLLSNTSLGKDLAPRIAVRLNAGIMLDCIHLEINSGEIMGTRPVYAGKSLVDMKIKSVKKSDYNKTECL